MLVAQDREEPSFEISAGLKAFNIGVRPQEGFLNQIGSANRIAAQRAREIVHLGHESDHVIGYHLLRLHSCFTWWGKLQSSMQRSSRRLAARRGAASDVLVGGF